MIGEFRTAILAFLAVLAAAAAVVVLRGEAASAAKKIKNAAGSIDVVRSGGFSPSGGGE